MTFSWWVVGIAGGVSILIAIAFAESWWYRFDR